MCTSRSYHWRLKIRSSFRPFNFASAHVLFFFTESSHLDWFCTFLINLVILSLLAFLSPLLSYLLACSFCNLAVQYTYAYMVISLIYLLNTWSCLQIWFVSSFDFNLDLMFLLIVPPLVRVELRFVWFQSSSVFSEIHYNLLAMFAVVDGVCNNNTTVAGKQYKPPIPKLQIQLRTIHFLAYIFYYCF